MATKAKGTFVDANVLIEIILSRPQEKAARKAITDYAGNLYISALTAHLVVHFGLARTRLGILRKFLADYNVLPLTEGNIGWAFTNCVGDDFEDALQLAVAVDGKCARFITFDKSLVKNYQHLGILDLQLAQ